METSSMREIAKHFLPGVLERRAHEITLRVVKDEKTVVKGCRVPQGELRVLSIERVNVVLCEFGLRVRPYGSHDSFGLLGQHVECGRRLSYPSTRTMLRCARRTERGQQLECIVDLASKKTLCFGAS